MIHGSTFIYSVSITVLGGLLSGVNPYFSLYGILKLGWTQNQCDVFKSILTAITLFLSLVLPFIIFYSQGRKVDLKTQLKSIIISLYLGAFLGGYLGRLIGETAMASLIGIGGILQQFPKVALRYIHPYLLGSLDALFISFTAMSIGYFREKEATPFP